MEESSTLKDNTEKQENNEKKEDAENIQNSNFNFMDIAVSKLPVRPLWFETEEAWDFFKSFDKFREDDLLISTIAKTGTTVIQQICHLLRGGDMNFEDLNFEMVFMELIYNYGTKYEECNAFQKYKQRVFKLHSPLSISTKLFGKLRHIVTIRDPISTFKSFYNFLTQKELPFFPKTFDIFCLSYDKVGFFGIDYFKQTAENYKCRNCDNILLLVYEDFEENPSEFIKKIVDFMRVDNYDLKEILRMTTKEFMLDNVTKFDDVLLEKFMETSGRPRTILKFKGAPKVTNGEHHTKLILGEAARNRLQQNWDDTIGKEFGFKSYEEMRNSYKKEQESNK